MKIKIFIAIVVAILLLPALYFLQIENDAINERRGYVSNQMRNPESVKFRSEVLMNSGWLCGEVNSQNAYGGYVGYKRFMSAGANIF